MPRQKRFALKRKLTTFDDENESTKEAKGKDSADTTPGTSSSGHSPALHDNQPASEHRILPGQDTSRPIKIPRLHKTPEEQFIDADDDISVFFGTLIDPEDTSHDPGAPVPDFHPTATRSRPDRSKLKLVGLKKFKPRYFDRGSKGFRPSREEDVDAVDGLIENDSKLSLADVSQQEKQRRFDDVAQRLRAIGDSVERAIGNSVERAIGDSVERAIGDSVERAIGNSVVIRRESNSTGSSLVHGSDTHRRRLSHVSQQEKQRRFGDIAQRLRAIGDSVERAEGDIVVSRRESDSAGSSSEHESQTHRRRVSQTEELRQYGDIGERVRSVLSNISVSETIIRSVMQILRAQDYSSFQTVVKREIENTDDWEQVAWYTYLIRATMDVAKSGQCLTSKVKNYATRYFTSNIRPWIQSRPLGWESIHEKTDIETKLD